MKTVSPMVSIITPAYNSAQFIMDTIVSVQKQTFEDWELLIVDDASTDETFSILESLARKDRRIKPFLLENNSGAAVTRNKGLKEATGRYIAFLDSDDQWYPTKLEKQLAFVQEKRAPISFTSYDLVNEDNEALNKIIRCVPKLDYVSHFKNTIICTSTSMIDTELVGRDFSFVNIRTRQDCYLWITLLKRGHLAYGLDEVLMSYRVRKDSISANKFKAAAKVWYLYYDLEKLGFFKSAYYFSFYAFNAVKKRVFG